MYVFDVNVEAPPVGSHVCALVADVMLGGMFSVLMVFHNVVGFGNEFTLAAGVGLPLVNILDMIAQ